MTNIEKYQQDIKKHLSEGKSLQEALKLVYLFYTGKEKCDGISVIGWLADEDVRRQIFLDEKVEIISIIGTYSNRDITISKRALDRSAKKPILEIVIGETIIRRNIDDDILNALIYDVAYTPKQLGIFNTTIDDE